MSTGPAAPRPQRRELSSVAISTSVTAVSGIFSRRHLPSTFSTGARPRPGCPTVPGRGPRCDRPEARERRAAQARRGGPVPEALARAARVRPTYTSLVERGRRDPKVSSVKKIARGLKVGVGELVAEAEGAG